MKILNKIIAYFKLAGEKIELEVKSAEIKEGVAYLHPIDNTDTYCVKSSDINIFLNYDSEINENDIVIISNNNNSNKDDNSVQSNETTKNKNSQNKTNGASTQYKTQKRKFTVTLYPDEYDSVMSRMKEYGYKRSDFFLACVNTARKSTMEPACKKIVKDHKSRILAEQELLKKQK